ncbi:MAG TPA: hypothetical protein VL461_04260 [Dictyobacter sp.]|jgi:DNA-binding NarL/FixJ family response regulator|nr:hypothetical protein [Dictyobacter sp.]
MDSTRIPVIIIDDTPVKLRGMCECVKETRSLQLAGQTGDVDAALALVEGFSQRQEQNTALAGWLVVSDLRLGASNGVVLGRSLLEVAPGLRIVIYTQEPGWTFAAEIFRQEYTRRGVPRAMHRHATKTAGLHGYALFCNMEPAYLERIAEAVVMRKETFIDPEVLDHLLRRLRGQRLTPRQEECALLIARGLSNDEIALQMGFLSSKGRSNIGPVENLVSELYTFFSIMGSPSDPGRRVLLAHAYEAYAGLRREPLPE